MIKSMTGFGRAEQIIDGRDIIVEIRSVNHRYYEFSARVPRAYGYIEEKLKSFLNGRISRGKVEVSVSIAAVEAADTLIEINKAVAKGYVDALRSVGEELGLADDLTLSQLVRLPDIFTVRKTADDEEQIWNSVKTVADEAVSKFISMREAEGLKMKEDVLERADIIERLVDEVERLSPISAENYRSKLYSRLCEVLADKNIDEQRIVTEAAIFADKTAVAEETVRLKSHIRQLRDMLALDEPVGRKLDFLIQEFNREANTIGSKAQDIAVTKIVVDLKSEIEKIREQIQNIE
ncbi:MAG: YicC/YloC family endoribonuclease [Oscillospiraceae bacterium]|nr:YicC family protein [Oscillospiraceae bacterium]MDD7278984.1 YicC family protein [Oscillospiraceae bacterium]MDY2864377.1 YicC/YloC family endoribonuclease [Oscillospiraceae bacterium]